MDPKVPTVSTRLFWTAFLRNLCACVAAYYLGLKFIYPGYFHPLAAHHSDMYMVALAAANNIDWAAAWNYARPVLMLAGSAAGDLGFEGAIILFSIVQLLNLAALLTLLELFLVKRQIHFSVALLTALVAVCAPGFYISHTHDLGAVLAMFFGLIAIAFVEAAGPTLCVRAWLGFFLFCLLSALTKESFIPALAIYACLAAWRRRLSWRAACLLVLIPFVATAASLAHSASVKSVFVNTSATPSDPYHISLAPASLLKASTYYLRAIAEPAFLLVLVAAVAAAYFKGRLRLALCLVALGLSLYAPYLILPNHLMAYYWWSPIPFWMLLIPVGLTAAEQSNTATTPVINSRSLINWSISAIIWVSCSVSLVQFRSFNRDNGSWFLLQQDINRNLMTSLRAIKMDLVGAKSTLILGIDCPFHPWVHPNVLAQELGYNGTWYLPLSLGNSMKKSVPRVIIADLFSEQLREFDVVLVFDKIGHLMSKYSRSNLSRLPEIIGVEGKEMPLLLGSPNIFIDVLQTTGATNPDRNAEVGLELHKIGCNSLAANFLLKAVKDPAYRNPYAYFFLGKIMLIQGNLSAAINYFSRAVEYDNASNKNHFFAQELENAKILLKRAGEKPKN